jgi:hypothetical protein
MPYQMPPYKALWYGGKFTNDEGEGMRHYAEIHLQGVKKSKNAQGS